MAEMYGDDNIHGESEAEMQKRIISKLIREGEAKGLIEGEKYFIISIQWWKQWRYFVGYDYNSRSAPKPDEIDNRNLFEDVEEDLLKKNLTEKYEYAILSKDVWDQLFQWYGGGPAIERECIKMSHHRQLVVEIRKLKLQIIWSRQVKKPVTMYFSKGATLKEFIDEMHKIWKFNKNRIRVYDFHSARKVAQLTSMDKRLCEAQIIDGQKMLIEEQKKSGEWPNQKIYHSYASSSGYNVAPSPPGQTGLSNLGNTCFMNSALQCLSAAAPLTDYFLNGTYVKDINEDNPLGMKGEMASEYSDLLKQLWSARIGSYQPRSFKGAIQKFAPQFAGYSQHDSQELLAFVLDGLHEDLNRIIKKPYVEIKDNWSAEEAWEGHRKRNDSIIVDLFQGQLKSRLECPNNGRVSNQFDPFMYLTAPLPIVNTRRIPITIYRLDPSVKPVQYGVVVEKDGTIEDLKDAVGQFIGVKGECIALVDVFQHRFHKEFNDHEDVSDVQDNDIIAAHEIAPRKKNKNQNFKGRVYGAGVSAGAIVAYNGNHNHNHNHNMNFDNDSDEDVEDDNKGPQFVRVVVLQKNTQNAAKKLFGVPFILSVPTDITYTDLYKNIVLKLSGGEVSGHAGAFTSVPDSINITTTDAAEHVEASDGDDSYDNDGTVFSLHSGNHYGQINFQLRNDGKALNLKDRQTICCLWEKGQIRNYIDNDYYESNTDPSITRHESVSVKDKKDSGIILEDCLKLFNQEEKLGKGDAWYCSECDEHVQAKKKFDIWKAPKILVIQLKRFSYRNRNYRERLDHLVKFPLKDFDISPFVVGDCDHSLVYDLFAVSNHFGSMGGGHYTAFAKSRTSEQWYRYDDSSVSMASPEQVVSSAAYLLFYKRQDVEWPEYNGTEPENEEKNSSEDDDPDDYETGDSDDSDQLSDGDEEANTSV